MDDGAWSTLLQRVIAERLTGLLDAAVTGGVVPLSAAQLEQAQSAHREAAGSTLLLERMLLKAADVLEGAGITYRVLKGPAVAHTLYPNPSLRTFGDIDLLIPTALYADGLTVLTSAGWRRDFPEPRSGFDARFGKGTPLKGPDGYEIDLHRMFVFGPLGMAVDMQQLFTTSTEFELAGRPLKGLGKEEQFLHVCMNAAIGNSTPRLIPLRDVAQMLLITDVDLDRVLSLAAAWQVEAVVARAILLAWETLELVDVAPLLTWACRYEPTSAEERTLGLYIGEPREGRQALAMLRLISGIRAKASFVRALAFPQNDLLDKVGRGRMEWWRRGLELLPAFRRHGRRV
jgi:hypothetical protein